MDVSIEQLLSIGIVGALLSVAMEWLKAKYTMESVEARIITIVGAIVLGTVVWALQMNAVLWQSILGVLATASMVYAVVIKSIK